MTRPRSCCRTSGSTPVEELRGRRAVVGAAGARARWPDAKPSTLDRQALPRARRGMGARESRLCRSLPRRCAAARVVAAGDEPPVVVTDDLGAGRSVADALLGNDPAVAADAVRRGPRAIATLHVATAGAAGKPSGRAVDERPGTCRVCGVADVASTSRTPRRVLDGQCGSLGVPVPTGALRRTARACANASARRRPRRAHPGRHLPGQQRPPRRPASCCVDFEGAQWRHLAWDVAYLLGALADLLVLLAAYPATVADRRSPTTARDRRRGASRRSPTARSRPTSTRPTAAGRCSRRRWFIDNALGERSAGQSGEADADPASDDHASPRASPARAERPGRSPSSPVGSAPRCAARWGDVPARVGPGVHRR